MSVVGVGIDLVDIPRIHRMLTDGGDRFLQRLLTDSERAYCVAQPLPARHVAVRIAAKEAAYKALQADAEARSVGWKEMEVIRDGEGKPGLRFHGRAREAADRLKVQTAHLSLSHTDHNAAAVVVLSS